MATSKENSSGIDPAMKHLEKAGAFGEYRLYKGGERVREALRHYIQPLLRSQSLQGLAVVYESSSSPVYPFGTIRLLAVLNSGSAIEEHARKLGKEIKEGYPDLPLEFYVTSRGENRNIPQEAFIEFANGIEPEIIDLSNLRPGLTK